jgi:hypothetical protein
VARSADNVERLAGTDPPTPLRHLTTVWAHVVCSVVLVSGRGAIDSLPTRNQHGFMRGVLGALLLVGCAVSAEPEERLVTRCSGVLPGSEGIGFWYESELVLEGDRWVAQDASGRVFVTGEAADGLGSDGRVYVALDWRGAENGGEFEMSPLGATLRVQYRDQDGNVEWSWPACFPQ